MNTVITTSADDTLNNVDQDARYVRRMINATEYIEMDEAEMIKEEVLAETWVMENLELLNHIINMIEELDNEVSCLPDLPNSDSITQGLPVAMAIEGAVDNDNYIHALWQLLGISLTRKHY